MSACKYVVARLWGSLFSQLTRDRTRGHRLRVHQGRFSPDMSKNFLMKRLLRQWEGLPKKVVELPSMELFRKGLDRALSVLM